MKTSYVYSRKEIFARKLSGKGFDVRRNDLPQQLRRWLVDYEIMVPHNEKYGTRYTYVCKHPVRIWHMNGKDENELITVDHLNPGDIWTF